MIKYFDIIPVRAGIPPASVDFEPFHIMTDFEMHNLFSPKGTTVIPVRVLKPVGLGGDVKIVREKGEWYIEKKVWGKMGDSNG